MSYLEIIAHALRAQAALDLLDSVPPCFSPEGPGFTPANRRILVRRLLRLQSMMARA